MGHPHGGLPGLCRPGGAASLSLLPPRHKVGGLEEGLAPGVTLGGVWNLPLPCRSWLLSHRTLDVHTLAPLAKHPVPQRLCWGLQGHWPGRVLTAPLGERVGLGLEASPGSHGDL